MKHSFFFVILTCSMLLMAMTACERSELQKSAINDTNSISTREVADCDDCPIDHCCCGLQLVNTATPIFFRLCGTSDGTGSCSYSPPGPCSSINGGGQSKTLQFTDPKLLFCMAKGNSLSVWNTNLLTPAIVTLTCQEDVANPQTILDTIPAGMTHFYLINNSCIGDECEP